MVRLENVEGLLTTALFLNATVNFFVGGVSSERIRMELLQYSIFSRVPYKSSIAEVFNLA